MKYLRTLIIDFCLVFFMSLFGTMILFSIPFNGKGVIWWRISRFRACWLVRIGRTIEILVAGQEKLDIRNSAKLMSNHNSPFDAPTMIAVSKKIPFNSPSIKFELLSQL